MGAKAATGSRELGAKIKKRRNELGLTIEEAASKSGVGTKTWSRYETGGSIRRDKVMNICKTLKWHILPEQENDEMMLDINDYKKRKIWSKALTKEFGEGAAVSFAIGSDILLDYIEQDMNTLECKPKRTHIGELDFSYLKDCMPRQFLMNYDYELLYCMRSKVIRYRKLAGEGYGFVAHTVLDEIVLYNIVEESTFLMEETIIPNLSPMKINSYNNWNAWIFDLFDDMDVVTFLYSDTYIPQNHSYHFDHWLDEQFHCDY